MVIKSESIYQANYTQVWSYFGSKIVMLAKTEYLNRYSALPYFIAFCELWGTVTSKKFQYRNCNNLKLKPLSILLRTLALYRNK